MLAELVEMTDRGRPGSRYLLTAADGIGGVLEVCGGTAVPRTGAVLSLVGDPRTLGSVRFVGEVIGGAQVPTGPARRHVALEWRALAAVDRRSDLVRALALVSIESHMSPGPDELAVGVELVYEPASQQVRLTQVRDGRLRHPTQEIHLAARDLPLAAQPSGMLVATEERPNTAPWRTTTLDDDDNDTSFNGRPTATETVPYLQRFTAQLEMDRTQPGVPPDVSPDVLLTPTIANQHTPPAWPEPAPRRDVCAVPPSSPPPTPPAPPAPQLKGTDRSWRVRMESESWLEMGSYRMGAQKVEALAAPGDRRPKPAAAPSGRSALRPGRPQPQRPQPNVRRSTSPPPRPTVMPPLATGHAPEFQRDPAEGTLEFGDQRVPLLCDALGQRSVSLIVMSDVPLRRGQPVAAHLPLSPLDRGTVEVPATVRTCSRTPRDGQWRVQIALRMPTPNGYRRLVQYWAQSRRQMP